MGDDVQQKALHVSVLNSTLLLVGSTVAYGAFYLITRLGVNDQRALLQMLIMSFALWRFANLAISAHINREAVRRSSGALPPDLGRVPLLSLLRSRLMAQLRNYQFAFVRIT
jgi:hypothetical protein